MTREGCPVVSVVGKKNSGKTRTVETLTSILSKRGFRVGVIKHIHHEGFTMDTPGKDTWRHAQAGARLVMAVSPEEIGIIRRIHASDLSLEDMLRYTEGEDLDLVLLEGFHMKTSDRRDVYKIVSAKGERELSQTMKDVSPPILAIIGPVARNDTKADMHVPVLDLETERNLLARIVEEQVLRRERSRRIQVTD